MCETPLTHHHFHKQENSYLRCLSLSSFCLQPQTFGVALGQAPGCLFPAKPGSQAMRQSQLWPGSGSYQQEHSRKAVAAGLASLIGLSRGAEMGTGGRALGTV